MIDLRRLSDKELQRELERRRQCEQEGVCSYCGGSYDEPACNRSGRHKAAGKLFHRGWKMECGSNWISARKGDRSITINRYNGSASLFEYGFRVHCFHVVVADNRFMFTSAVDIAERRKQSVL